jgi:hypothetical protein
MTLPISWDDPPSLFTVADVTPAMLTASVATRAASAAFSEISRIDASICSPPPDTVLTLREISFAMADTVCDCADVSSVEVAICAATADSRCEEPYSDDADASMVDMTCRSRPTAASSAWPISPGPSRRARHGTSDHWYA